MVFLGNLPEQAPLYLISPKTWPKSASWADPVCGNNVEQTAGSVKENAKFYNTMFYNLSTGPLISSTRRYCKLNQCRDINRKLETSVKVYYNVYQD